MLAGNVVALLSPMVFVPVLSYAFGPQHYDWQSMLAIRLGHDKELKEAAHVVDVEGIAGHPVSVVDPTQTAEEFAAEQASLKRSVKIAGGLTVFLTLALLVLWPMPMYASSYVFSKQFFTGWVVVGIIWMFFAVFCVGLYPLFEGRNSLARTAKFMIRDMTGKRRKRNIAIEGQRETSETSSREGVSRVVEKDKA